MRTAESNRQFDQYCDRLRARIQGYAWTAFAWLVSTINDRILPEGRGIDAEAIALWCRQYLDDHNPGPTQYRGLPVDEDYLAALSQAKQPIEQFWYRGQVIDLKPHTRQVPLLSPSTLQPFQPFYQRQLREWIDRSRWTDRDGSSPSPELDASYRGRAL